MREPIGDRQRRHRPRRGPRAPGRTLRRVGLLSAIVLLAACTSSPDGPDPAAPTSEVATVGPDVTTDVDAPGITGGRPATPTPTARPVTPRSTTGTAPSSIAPSRPVVPAVVGLRWLGSDPRPAGPRITLADGTERWQGAVSGEYAIRSADGRRWFGADGSAVLCRGALTCVGFDPSGNVAVLDGTTVRSVYDAAGSPLGIWTADGRQRSAPQQPSFAQALAGTGLDLGALVDEAGRRVPFAGGVTGDPHLVTGGGRRVSWQYTGDFEARSGDPQRRIQLRWAAMPHQSDVTITTSIAIATGGTVVQIDDDGKVLIGGVAVQTRDSFQQIRITGGPVVGTWALAADGSSSVALLWSDGSALAVQTDPALGLTAVLTAPRSSSVRGIFGTGDPTSVDLVDREGIALDARSVLADWSVPVGDSLFDVRGSGTIGYPTDVPSVPDEAVPFATRVCRARGVTVNPDLAACLFDVGITGDARFAIGHGHLAGAAQLTVPSVLATRWPAMQDRASTSASQLPTLVDVRPGLGQQLVYSVPVAGSGRLGFQFVSGCPSDTALLEVDRPALRLFDPTGQAVSARFPACGRFVVDGLAPGRYRLVVAGAMVGELRTVRFDVSEG